MEVIAQNGMINCKYLQQVLLDNNQILSRCSLGNRLDCENCDSRINSRTKELTSSAKAIIKNPKLVSKELIVLRRDTCDKCKHKKGRRCKICGCFLDVKIKFLATHCPIGKW